MPYLSKFVSSYRFALLSIIACAVALTACSGSTAAAPGATATSVPASGAPVTIKVFAAASLQDAFGEIGRNYEAANPGVKVAFNFAGSQQLAQQIAQVAPADVFASANKAQMTVAIQSGRVVSGTEKVFARNRLVVVVPRDNPAKLQTLQETRAGGEGSAGRAVCARFPDKDAERQ